MRQLMDPWRWKSRYRSDCLKEMKRIIHIVLFLFFGVYATAEMSGQGTLRGRVIDAGSGQPLVAAAVVVDRGMGSYSDQDGTYTIDRLTEGRHELNVSLLGYQPFKTWFKIAGGDTLFIETLLYVSYINAGEVVVTASRTEDLLADIPSRVNVIGAPVVRATPALTTDDFLATVPGINVSRSFGIFSHKANVTMRGLSGKEQARVLVMIDGIPVNKADGGSVNWNLLDPEMIERIEVVKGPVSAVYGSNAMGGAVNIITRKPGSKPLLMLKTAYGTYNTFTGRMYLSHRPGGVEGRGFYFSINGFHRQSEGYITQSEYERQANPYIVPSNVWEMSGNLKAGYDFSSRESIELDITVYDDERGTGEKVHMPNGNTADHDTYQARARYRLKGDRISADISGFMLLEQYRRVNEYMKDDYTWYDVESERTDAGLLSSLKYSFSENHSLSGGADFKLGGVDAFDMYYTSTDIVYNKGKMFTAGLYLQDELSLIDERLRIVAGLRYDLAHFFDGAFFIETPSAETAFMSDIVDNDMENASWSALSPRLSAKFSLNDNVRLYATTGSGFRPSVLDDLCRSGRMKGGFKLANPDVVPEKIMNYEAGADINIGEKVTASLSTFFSRGREFLYYVNTGDSIELSYGLRPIYASTNIPKVEIGGVEAEISWTPGISLSCTASYSFTSSVIREYKALAVEDPVDLTGKHLTDVPSHIFSFSARWENRFVDASLRVRYQSRMWVNDQNIFDEVTGSARYPAYCTCDVRLSREIRFADISLDVQNLFDAEFYDSGGSVCPGRFIILGLGIKLR